VSVAQSGVFNARIQSCVVDAQARYHQALLLGARPVQPEPLPVPTSGHSELARRRIAAVARRSFNQSINHAFLEWSK